ncbi:MAG: hypothetical protein ACR2PW_06315, partial [Gammaproteobacteria bacterium]
PSEGCARSAWGGLQKPSAEPPPASFCAKCNGVAESRRLVLRLRLYATHRRHSARSETESQNPEGLYSGHVCMPPTGVILREVKRSRSMTVTFSLKALLDELEVRGIVDADVFKCWECPQIPLPRRGVREAHGVVYRSRAQSPHRRHSARSETESQNPEGLCSDYACMPPTGVILRKVKRSRRIQKACAQITPVCPPPASFCVE